MNDKQLEEIQREVMLRGRGDQIARLQAENEQLRAVLEQIHGNIQGLGDGKQPNITEPARVYFRIIERLCRSALVDRPGERTTS